MKAVAVVAAILIAGVGGYFGYMHMFSCPGTPLEGTNPNCNYITVEAEDQMATISKDGNTATTNVIRNVFPREAQKDVDVSKTASNGEVRVFVGSISSGVRREVVLGAKVPKAGKYVCWLRGMGGVCNHTGSEMIVTVQQPDMDTMGMGTFKLNSKMSWMRGDDKPEPTQLKEGSIFIKLRGAGCCEQEVGVDRVLVTDDLNYVPRP